MSNINQFTTVTELFSLQQDVPVISGAEFKKLCQQENVIALGTLRNDKGVVVEEVTSFNGKCYKSDINMNHQKGNYGGGNTREIEDNDKIYFAQIATLSENKITRQFKEITYPDLQNFLANSLFKENPELAGACGIKIKSTVEAVIRSVDGGKEYDFDGNTRKAENLAEIMKNQTERRLWRTKVTGSAILCDWEKGGAAAMESPSMLHIHLVTDNERTGGHMQPYASLKNKDPAQNPVIFHNLEIEVGAAIEWKIAKNDGKGGIEFVPATPATSQTADQIKQAKLSLQQLMQFGYSKS